MCNICPNYAATIAEGFHRGGRRPPPGWTRRAGRRIRGEVLRCVLRSIDAVLCLTRRYRDAALAAGRGDIAALLRAFRPRARTFHEALQTSDTALHALVRGRVPQYDRPFRPVHDALSGRRSGRRASDARGRVRALLEFFLTFNRDSDLYPGVQQGDNGQR